MPRLRFGDDNRAVTIGAGISGGQYGGLAAWLASAVSCVDGPPCAPATSPATRYVVWSNVEIGWQHWWPGGFAMRYFAGYGVGFGGGDNFSTPYFGLGIGYAF
jgi:hypothetical protein